MSSPVEPPILWLPFSSAYQVEFSGIPPKLVPIGRLAGYLFSQLQVRGFDGTSVRFLLSRVSIIQKEFHFCAVSLTWRSLFGHMHRIQGGFTFSATHDALSLWLTAYYSNKRRKALILQAHRRMLLGARDAAAKSSSRLPSVFGFRGSMSEFSLATTSLLVRSSVHCRRPKRP